MVLWVKFSQIRLHKVYHSFICDYITATFRCMAGAYNSRQVQSNLNKIQETILIDIFVNICCILIELYVPNIAEETINHLIWMLRKYSESKGVDLLCNKVTRVMQKENNLFLSLPSHQKVSVHWYSYPLNGEAMVAHIRREWHMPKLKKKYLNGRFFTKKSKNIHRDTLIVCFVKCIILYV